MEHHSLSFKEALSITAITGLFMITGCTSQSKDRSPDWSRNEDAIKMVESSSVLVEGSETESMALQRFTEFYADYSVPAIRAGIRDVYADEAWFGDPFHIVEGIEDLEHYFVVMAEPVEQCTFIIDSIQRSGNDHFARWTMVLESKAAKGEIIKTIGISHVRFNAAGKVIFQQDYWDASAMLDRLPIVGYWTRLVKDRISKGLEK